MGKIVGPQNKALGTSFEKSFEKQARLQGFLVIKNNISARYSYGGRLVPVKSDLDFKIITRGVIGLFDCKTYEDNFFPYSKIDEDQLEKALLYEDWGIPAGFIVYFRSTSQIVFYKASRIAAKGPRSRFDLSDGCLLGTIFRFNLKPIMEV